MPTSTQVILSNPLDQTLRPAMMASVPPAMANSRPVRAGAPAVPARNRVPAAPDVTPAISTTNPESSVGNKGRSLCSTRDSADSTTPAKTVIPKSSGSPPSLTAPSDGPRKAAV